ncbi:purine-cytosine permease family protein [Heyndrickxia ginsengihumi]|uniref:purine-cytosine permease family protein n=1 Tax=Heyndrickxia ginsengihumi TaxID=363870 RepID=UPI000A543586|nr:hypothetical protein [Heyndrickxia ginsengihumi]
MLAVICAGPGWVILAGIQQIIGSFLSANTAVALGLQKATIPAAMFENAFSMVFGSPLTSLTIATFLVLLSQMKINATNAYSGSLSWSNFFSRTLHFHPGRVIWLIFQVIVGLLIMEVGIIDALNTVLGFYSNVAVAWIGAVFADIIINKRILKIGPTYIEFKRAHLYNFNPVGFGSMIIASVLSLATYFGVFGAGLKPYSAFISLLLAIVLTPVIAILTRGKYYIARDSSAYFSNNNVKQHHEIKCVSCGNHYETHDLAFCPFHEGAICSMCCSLESTCHDMCKTQDQEDKSIEKNKYRKTNLKTYI